MPFGVSLKECFSNFCGISFFLPTLSDGATAGWTPLPIWLDLIVLLKPNQAFLQDHKKQTVFQREGPACQLFVELAVILVVTQHVASENQTKLLYPSIHGHESKAHCSSSL
jgi:hypothetical protein